MTEAVNQTNTVKQHFRIRVINRDQEYSCEAGKSLLTGMESDYEHCINIGCRGGGCGVCKIRILEGMYQQKRMSKAHIKEQDIEQGFALACRIFPSGDMVIESDHQQAPAGTQQQSEKDVKNN